MTPDAQRIAIAEACGWVEHEINSDSWYKNSGHKFSAPTGTSPFLGRHSIPDYLTDLNAMHEAEKTLQHYGAFVDVLAEVIKQPRQSIIIVHATASQRAEAFLKTIGKWEASK